MPNTLHSFSGTFSISVIVIISLSPGDRLYMGHSLTSPPPIPTLSCKLHETGALGLLLRHLVISKCSANSHRKRSMTTSLALLFITMVSSSENAHCFSFLLSNKYSIFSSVLNPHIPPFSLLFLLTPDLFLPSQPREI